MQLLWSVFLQIDAEGSVEEVFSEVLSCLQRTNSDSATDPCTRLVQRRSCWRQDDNKDAMPMTRSVR